MSCFLLIPGRVDATFSTANGDPNTIQKHVFIGVKTYVNLILNKLAKLSENMFSLLLWGIVYCVKKYISLT
jgi:hypothetical protein